MPYDTTIPGHLDQRGLEVIETWAVRYDPKIIVEVGSFMGRSAVAWAASAPKADVYCIESFEFKKFILDKDRVIILYKEMMKGRTLTESCYPRQGLQEELFRKYTQPYPNIHTLKGRCPEIRYEGEIDIFFLDAGHENPNDWDIIEAHLPNITTLICGHDAGLPAVNENIKRLESILDKPVTRQKSSYHFPSYTMWSFEL